MPAHPELPSVLKSALESMEASVQAAKQSLAFAAPEMQDTHWILLQQRLAETYMEMFAKARERDEQEIDKIINVVRANMQGTFSMALGSSPRAYDTSDKIGHGMARAIRIALERQETNSTQEA